MGIEENMRRTADELAGRAKEAWGDMTDNERLEAEGRAQHTHDDNRVTDPLLDESRVDRLNDDVADDIHTHAGDDGTLRDALRDDMGQEHVHAPEGGFHGDPGDDGALRESLRDDMGQDLHSGDDPNTGDLRNTPHRDQI
ncbi:MAG TPA: CsbD family protein [Arachnia sp.]|nr:CsbD family protein [Arachnia sp.]